MDQIRWVDYARVREEIDDLQAQLDAVTKEEPVFEVGFGWLDDATKYPRGTKLYVAPPQRKPLTEEEMYAVEDEAIKNFRLSQSGPRGQTISYWESLTPWLIRATEKAHGIGE